MENLDLDINNYSIKDLETFFRLKPKSKYSAADIELKEYQIREQLLNSGHVNKRFKQELIAFLEVAKTRLTMAITKPLPPPTSIPKDYKLDTMDVPRSKEAMARTEELIVRPETQFMYTNNSDFFPGQLNPLNTRIVTKCLNIDTRFRDKFYSTQSSDFMIQLPTKFNKVVSMQLSSLEFPVAFYGISADYGNNFLTLTVKHHSLDLSGTTVVVGTDTVTSVETLIVPDGNYNANDLIILMNDLLSPVGLDGTLTNPTSIFSYIQLKLDISSSGSGSGKVTIEANGKYASSVLEISMDFTLDINGNKDSLNVSAKIGWNLGFILPSYSGKTSYVADTIIEPAAIRYIYLAVDDFNNSASNQFISVFEKSVVHPDILARISIKGSYFSLIMESDFNIVTEPRRYFGPVDIQRLRIRIFDEHGRILPMNNSNFSFCLDLKMLYDL
jgi:hypothetical protein